MGQVLDPTVSRNKFDREVSKYKQLEDEHIRRGWLLIKAEFPRILMVLAALN